MRAEHQQFGVLTFPSLSISPISIRPAIHPPFISLPLSLLIHLSCSLSTPLCFVTVRALVSRYLLLLMVPGRTQSTQQCFAQTASSLLSPEFLFCNCRIWQVCGWLGAGQLGELGEFHPLPRDAVCNEHYCG